MTAPTGTSCEHTRDKRMVTAPHSDDIVVEASGLTKTFRDFWGRPKARAVNGVDLSVKRGQVFGLLGPNGSGKSTTVKLILGLLYPTRGSLRVLNESPRNVQMKRRIGYLPEESYLYRYLTAAETLDFFAALFGLTSEERTRRCTQLLEMVGLTNSRNRPVGEFSKGMARRIGLAQALVNDPDLVVLDEPTSGLDPIGCREVKDVIRLLASRGKTVIMCSHLLSDVEDVCDEVVVLYGGKIRAQGTLKDILTVQERTRILAPRLEPELTDEIICLIKARLGRDDVEVDHPTMDLEDFFLDVVRQAREASVATAGAQAGGRIAEYLQGTPSDTPSQKILEALAAGPSAQDPRPGPEAEGQSTPEAADVDQSKLEDLAGGREQAGGQESGAAVEEESVDKPEVSQRIEDVLRRKSAQKGD